MASISTLWFIPAVTPPPQCDDNVLRSSARAFQRRVIQSALWFAVHRYGRSGMPLLGWLDVLSAAFSCAPVASSTGTC
jgi:hypothetical protein